MLSHPNGFPEKQGGTSYQVSKFAPASLEGDVEKCEFAFGKAPFSRGESVKDGLKSALSFSSGTWSCSCESPLCLCSGLCFLSL